MPLYRKKPGEPVDAVQVPKEGDEPCMTLANWIENDDYPIRWSRKYKGCIFIASNAVLEDIASPDDWIIRHPYEQYEVVASRPFLSTYEPVNAVEGE